MTEKRFAVTQTVLGRGIYDFQAENELCESYDEDAYSQVVKKLNELYEENKQLRFDFKEMKGLLHSFEDEIERLEKENKEIKAKYNRCIEERAVYIYCYLAERDLLPLNYPFESGDRYVSFTPVNHGD